MNDAQNQNPMDAFDFFIGTWDLEYRVPESHISPEDFGTGKGKFTKALNDQYVFFDYQAALTSVRNAAHGVFSWDEKIGHYRYWWFEDTGVFLSATGNFTDADTLEMNWHDTLIRQTFKRVSADKIILRMDHPATSGQTEQLLEVIFTPAKTKKNKKSS